MTKDEALKLALGALKTIDEAMPFPVAKLAQAAIKEALAQPDFEKIADDLQNICDKQALKLGHLEALLAQPEQEPVGEIVDAIEGAFKCSFTKMLPVGAKLYTTPSQRKPLSEEEIGAILEDVNAYGTRLYTFARAIEAAHGIKGEA
jgi:hypothetical protein